MDIFISFFKLMPFNFVLISVFFSFLHNRIRLLDWYTELIAESNTSTIVVNRLGARRTIVTANLENVEYMLKTNFNNFPKGKTFTKILGGFLSYGIFNTFLDPFRLSTKLSTSPEICAKSGAAPLLFIWKVKRWLRVGSEKRMRYSVEEVHAYVEGIIHDKKKKTDYKCGGEDLLSRLITAGHDERYGHKLHHGRQGHNINSNDKAVLVAFMPSNNRGKIGKEIQKMGERLLDYESLKGLELLKALLSESMRLYGPVAWDSKHAMVDDILPDGTSV
ncbi:Sulfite oxidase [Hibiscus syriacus]|uniref:Sulfite oxidase n=1 Tax=Hibiscus syriacus TaxID=106335 RepID=A0A6A3C1Y5_HIBSY|nr:Sulfite oxidase [Hibiscus syriacus]